MWACLWMTAASPLHVATGELRGQPWPAPDGRAPWPAARDNSVTAKWGRTPAVSSRVLTAASKWSHIQGGLPGAFPPTQAQGPFAWLFVLAPSWASGAKHQPQRDGMLFSSIPHLPWVLGGGPSFRAFREPLLIRRSAAVFVPGVGAACSYSATLPKRMEGRVHLYPEQIRLSPNRQLCPSFTKGAQLLTEGGMYPANSNMWL